MNFQNEEKMKKKLILLFRARPAIELASLIYLIYIISPKKTWPPAHTGSAPRLLGFHTCSAEADEGKKKFLNKFLKNWLKNYFDEIFWTVELGVERGKDVDENFDENCFEFLMMFDVVMIWCMMCRGDMYIWTGGWC